MRLFFLLALALLPLGTRAEISGQAWLETYYLNPRPAEVPTMLRTLSREGFFEKQDQTAIAVGFFATLFAANPDKVTGWLAQWDGLPARVNRLIAAALWQAGNPLGAELLQVLGQRSPLQLEIQQLAQLDGRSVAETPVRSPASMNLQWGAFLASGDEKYLLNIFEAIGAREPGLDFAAQAALAQHAADHPRVLEICREQLARQPSEVQSVLRAAVKSVKASPGSI
jgi:hypothetical protein